MADAVLSTGGAGGAYAPSEWRLPRQPDFGSTAKARLIKSSGPPPSPTSAASSPTLAPLPPLQRSNRRAEDLISLALERVRGPGLPLAASAICTSRSPLRDGHRPRRARCHRRTSVSRRCQVLGLRPSLHSPLNFSWISGLFARAMISPGSRPVRSSTLDRFSTPVLRTNVIRPTRHLTSALGRLPLFGSAARVVPYGSAGVDPSEYSWCKPPSTDVARTSAPGVHRHRVSTFEVRADPAGGPGTPGPSALCGRPPL
jgi:hypothetical protein